MNQEHRALRHYLDQTLRAGVMWIMNRVTKRARREEVNLRNQHIKRILVVRGLFRLGDSILATPMIGLLRRNFPAATIDFVGPSVTKRLFQNLPINRYYEIYRRFPKVCWSYVALLKRLQRRNYDLALDASGSSAALGSVIVGFSGARFRIGVRGKWDRWFNLAVERPSSVNKYATLPELIASLGLESSSLFPALAFTAKDTVEGQKRVAALVSKRSGAIVGVFVGGRKSRGKRWPSANFVELATRLRAHGARPIIFVGPEEIDSLIYLQSVLAHRMPVVFEPDIKKFASLVANCHLFVACDSGPVHLACALPVRTVAIFLKNNFDRWGPPAELGRIVFHEGGVTVKDVLEACRLEFSALRDDHVVAKIVNG